MYRHQRKLATASATADTDLPSATNSASDSQFAATGFDSSPGSNEIDDHPHVSPRQEYDTGKEQDASMLPPVISPDTNHDLGVTFHGISSSFSHKT